MGLQVRVCLEESAVIDVECCWNVGATGGSTFRDFEAETRAMEARMGMYEDMRMDALVNCGIVMGKEGIGTSAAIYNGKQQDDPGKSRAQNLQDLFSPPREILFQVGWKV